MRWLSQFEPRLVGPVLTRHAPPSTPTSSCICLPIRAEYVALQLLDRGIAHEVTERRVRLDAERTKAFPGCASRSTTSRIEATVFPLDGIRQAPVSPVDGKPMRRADAAELKDCWRRGLERDARSAACASPSAT